VIAKNQKAATGFHGVLNFVVGLVLAGIGLLGFVLISWGIYNGRGPFDWVALAILAFVGGLSIAALFGGAIAIRFAIRCFLPGGVPIEEVSPEAAQLLEGRIIHDSSKQAVVLAWILLPMVILASFVTFPLLHSEPDTWLILLFPAALAAVLIFGGGPLFLRGRKFGKSICRLKTRQHLIGGAFEAEIEVEFPGTKTGLPDLPEGPIEVEILNKTAHGDEGGVIWRTRSTIPIHVLKRPGSGGLRIPVAIGIPSEGAQKIDGGTLSDCWELRVRGAYRGIDYASRFHVVVRQPDSGESPAWRTRPAGGMK